MYKGKRILGLVPARGGSKGVPRKNIKELCGKPLIAWTLREANRSCYLDECVVSTDDSEIASVVKNLGSDCEADVLMRPVELAKDDTPSIEVVLHAMREYPNFDCLVLLQPTSPMRVADDIDACIECCFDSVAQSCVSVTTPEESPYWMYEIDERGILVPLLNSANTVLRRQDAPSTYVLNGAVYASTYQSIRENRSLVTAETRAYIMPQDRSGDIDTIRDFEYMRLAMQCS